MLAGGVFKQVALQYPLVLGSSEIVLTETCAQNNKAKQHPSDEH